MVMVRLARAEDRWQSGGAIVRRHAQSECAASQLTRELMRRAETLAAETA
jgi:hypothetical protein